MSSQNISNGKHARGKRIVIESITWKVTTTAVVLWTCRVCAVCNSPPSQHRSVARQDYELVPALNDARRLYDPSMAASKDLMVSNGRSSRGRVGLDRSGSTIQGISDNFVSMEQADLTDDVSFRITMLQIPDRLYCSHLSSIANSCMRSTDGLSDDSLRREPTRLGFIDGFCWIGLCIYMESRFLFRRLCGINPGN